MRGAGGRGPEGNPGANFKHRLPPHEHHLADSWYNSMRGWAGAAAEIQWNKLSMLQPGDVSYKNTVKHQGAWYPYKLLAANACLIVSQCSDVAKASSAVGCLHVASLRIRGAEQGEEGSPFVLYKYQEYCIPFVFSLSILCKDSIVLREKHWTGAWKPPFAWIHCDSSSEKQSWELTYIIFLQKHSAKMT